MKKFLTTTTIVATILATTGAKALENNFFAKVNLGYSKMGNSLNLKSEDATFWGLGAGCYIMDNVRADLTFDHFVKPIFRSNGKKVTGEVDTLLLNGFIDLFDIVITKVFIGAGIGGSKVQANFSGNAFPKNGSSKTRYNLSYAAYLGCSVEFIPGVIGEVAYSYRDMGKSKDYYSNEIQFKGSQIAVGLRLSL
jgi:opacity protein-like surface antigen